MKPIEAYCRRVEKKLLCSKSTKRRLLDGLNGELCEAFPGAVEYETIVRDCGAPEDTAQQLQGAVAPREQRRAAMRKQRIPLCATLLIIALLVSFLFCYMSYVKTHDIVHYTTTIYEEYPPENDALVWSS